MTAFDVQWLREVFLECDRVSKPVMGIADWDDAACIAFGNKRLVLSCDGPYKKRLVMKSALIHAATDVIVKGARPLAALDTLSGSEKDVREMAESLRAQAKAMRIPILGGNTNLNGTSMDVFGGEPLASIFVFGELLLDEPIRDSGGKKGDALLLLGDSLWGEQDERFKKAKKLFSFWYSLLDDVNAGKVKINAAKDVTKGGLALTAKEIADKSGRKLELYGIKIHKYRNLDNFLLATDKKSAGFITKAAAKAKCPCIEAGRLK